MREPRYLNWLMVTKADEYRSVVHKAYFQSGATVMTMTIPKKSDIPKIIKEEHRDTPYMHMLTR